MSNRRYPVVILPIRNILQNTPFSCGPASLKMVLDFLGITVAEKKLANIAKTTPTHGTRPADLSKTLAHFHVRHRVFQHASLTILEEKIRTLQLCIVNFRAWKEGHYSVAFGYSATHILLADPYKKKSSKTTPAGFRAIRKDLFEKRWRDTFPDDEKTDHWMIAVPLKK